MHGPFSTSLHGRTMPAARSALVLLACCFTFWACGEGETPIDIEQLEPVVVRTAALWDADQGFEYSWTLLAAGGHGSFEWSVTDGQLPDGLVVSPSGLISGIPLMPGTWEFVVQATPEAGEPGSKELSLLVHPMPIITTVSLPDGRRGMSYAAILRATGGRGEYRWSVSQGALPAGLSLEAWGLVSGFPEATGSAEVTFMLTSGPRSVARSLSFDVGEVGPPPDSWSGVAPWRGYQRDAGHTGYVPVLLDPSRFKVRWRVYRGGGERVLGQIVTETGSAFLSEGFFSGVVTALDLASGAVRWELEDRGFGQPGTATGRVYATTANSVNSELLQIDAASGQVMFRVPFENQFTQYPPPVVVDGTIVSAGLEFGGVTAYSEADGSFLWSHDTWGESAPAAAGSTVYNVRSKGWTALQGFDLRTGDLQFEIPVQCDCGAASPVLASPDRVVVAIQGQIYGFDLTTNSIAWTREPATTIATVDGRLYVTSGAEVQVVDAQDGSLLETWQPPDGEPGGAQIAVTDNLLFLAFGGQVHAVDTSSWTEVWHHRGDGYMSLSEGMLILRATDGFITGVELGPSG